MVPTTTEQTPSRLIAIGVSADGVRALRELLQDLPSGCPAAIVITQHRGRDAESALVRVLSRSTKLRIKEAAPDEPLRAGVVYVAPPNRHLVVDESRVRLSDGAPVYFSRPSIDTMFRSVAASWGARAIGVILSGVGRDGAEALRALREAGGTVVVQYPADATFARLPQEAIAADHIHFILPIHEIGPLLVSLVSRSSDVDPPAADSPATAVANPRAPLRGAC
jgi:two-component system, chemotaxis family, protein-glutamate methylesterase/glutaminase